MQELYLFLTSNAEVLAFVGILTIVCAILDKTTKIFAPLKKIAHNIKAKIISRKQYKQNLSDNMDNLSKSINMLIESDKNQTALIQSLQQSLDQLNQSQIEQQKTMDLNELDSIRWEVLNFANSCRNGTRHTHDEFLHIIDRNGKYHTLLEKHKEENGVFDLEYEYIIDVYKQCQKDNSFLL